MNQVSSFGAYRRFNIFGLAALAIASVLAPAPGKAQVPGEAQNLSWCAGSKDCLQWSSTAGATQYRVYRGEQASMPCLVGAPLDSCLESVFPTATTGAGAIPEIPAPGRVYWFIVTAQNGTGEGPSGSVKLGPTTQPRARNTFGSCPSSCTAAPGSCLGANDCCSSNCAGSCQTACCTPPGGFCSQPSDCCSSLCVASVCQPCLALGQSCSTSATCCSGNCTGGLCVAACAPNGDQCATNSQCCSGTCSLGLCQPGCTQPGGSCVVGAQCCSGVCQFNTCLPPTCSDGVKNGSETGVDCGGGTCLPCGLGQGCNGGSDCQSQTCAGGTCVCGPPGASCTVSSQCCSGLCSGNVCAGLCGDGVVGGAEQCDDGNVVSGDGCSSACNGEPGYACTGSPSVCTPCPAGTSNCNGSEQDGCEVQTSTDPSNCGACNSVCSLPNATPTCVNGACNVGTCNVGYFNCNAQAIDGCEVHVTSDPNNCSSCGLVCSSNNIPVPSCSSGVCNGACAAGFLDCDGNKQANGCEVNVATSPTNCGGCGIVCSSSNIPVPSCSSGVCNGACATGYLDCNGNKQLDGCEVNTTNSPANCGGCGVVCSSLHITTPTCAASTCNGTCDAGWGDCNANKQTDGCETSLNTNTNCGTCGHACGIATQCIGGTCQAP